MGYMLLAGKQHFAFSEYKDPHGNRMFAGVRRGMQSGLSLFNWLKQELGITRFHCPLYSTLTALP